jgi:hypothetical protein
MLPAYGATVTSVEPGTPVLTQWVGIAGALTYLELSAALAITAVLAYVLAEAIVPSYLLSAVEPPAAALARWVRLAQRTLTVTAAGAGFLAGWAMIQAFRVAWLVAGQLYPRFLI